MFEECEKCGQEEINNHGNCWCCDDYKICSQCGALLGLCECIANESEVSDED